MFFRLLLLLTVVPIVELFLLLEVHRHIAEATSPATGLAVALGTILVTGLVGARLAKSQGLSVLRQIQRATDRGEFPGSALLDGALVLFGGALLLTPGYFTDVVGLSCLIPWTRRFHRRLLAGWLRHQVRQGHAFLRVRAEQRSGPGAGPAPNGRAGAFDFEPPRGQGPIIDVTPDDEPA